MSNNMINNIHTIIETTPSSKNFTQMKNGSIVFVFGNNMKPIACDIDYLYAETTQYPIYSVEQAELGILGNSVIPNYDSIIDPDTGKYIDPRNKSTIKYKFLDVINALKFRYGLKKEFYKNKNGKWIDITAIKPYFCLIDPRTNPFGHMFTGRIDNNIKELSIYKQLCDSNTFETDYSLIREICEVKDLNNVPAVDYYVKDPNRTTRDSSTNDVVSTKINNSANIYRIEKADGSYITDKCKHISFSLLEEDNVDIDHLFKTDSIRFSYKLYDINGDYRTSGDYDTNNHHMLNDLLLTFTYADGVTPYTDLSNLFIVLNNLVVDYLTGPNPNQIILKDVVKYAAFQPKSLKNEVFVDDYMNIEESELTGEKIINIDIPYDKVGMNYKFDIQIHKWENVKISHMTPPNSVKKLLKTKTTEPTKSFLLTTELQFGKTINKDKTILLCGNTIIDKDSWDVTSEGNIYLKTISAEFDILYAEMYDIMRDYLKSIIDHNIEDSPKLREILDNMESMNIENIEEAYQEYFNQLETWTNETGGDKYHNTKSVFDIIVNQFINRKYYVLYFDIDNIEDEFGFDVNIIENKNDIILNKPLRNHFRNINWNVDDIVVMNGLIHRFENKYDTVFTSPTVWYRMDNEGIYDDVYAYKIEVIKHYKKHDSFRKLTYGELLSGPSVFTEYFYRDTEKSYKIGLYFESEESYVDFEHTFKLISQETLDNGVDPYETYFRKVVSPTNEVSYEKIPILTLINNGFTPNVNYYKKIFTKDYYIKRK